MVTAWVPRRIFNERRNYGKQRILKSFGDSSDFIISGKRNPVLFLKEQVSKIQNPIEWENCQSVSDIVY